MNYLFADGAWFELTDMLGTRGRRLAPPMAQPEEDAPEPTTATAKQLQNFFNVTLSHVFDHDREALHTASSLATLEEMSQLLDYVLREVKDRKLAEQ